MLNEIKLNYLIPTPMDRVPASKTQATSVLNLPKQDQTKQTSRNPFFLAELNLSGQMRHLQNTVTRFKNSLYC